MSADKQGAGSILKDERDQNNPFDIFSMPEREPFMEKGKTQEIYSEIPVTDEGPYEFKINSQGKEYCMLPYTRLEGCLEIVKTDGTPYAGSVDDFSVCNMFPNSIFKQVECQVNGYVIFSIMFVLMKILLFI